jgi:hypothetical protein
MLLGAAIALLLIALFLLNAGAPDPAWPRFWMLRPLIIVPFAGAMGGLFYHLMHSLRAQGGWKRVLAHVLSLLVYVVGLWMGTVLGLDGTMWD